MNNEQPTSFSKLIEKLRSEYDQLKERVCSLNSFLCDIDFEKRVPDPKEQRLMREQIHMMLGYMDNLRARISYQESQQFRQLVEQNMPHIPIAAVEKRGSDIIIKQAHHCGQDASCQVGDGSAAVSEDVPESIKELEGMQVVKFVRGVNARCDTCPLDHYGTPCQKVELVGGHHLCLAPLPNSIVTE